MSDIFPGPWWVGYRDVSISKKDIEWLKRKIKIDEKKLEDIV